MEIIKMIIGNALFKMLMLSFGLGVLPGLDIASTSRTSLVNPSEDSLKQTYDVIDMNDDNVHGLTEVVWNRIRRVHYKKSISVSPKMQSLGINIYNGFTKAVRSMQQRATRISDIEFVWVPLSKKFTGLVTLTMFDTRFTVDKAMTGSGKGKASQSFGKLLSIISFDPNFVTLIYGSMDFAVATRDIDHIQFYINFDDEMKKDSTAGFLDVGWSTSGDSQGVYNKIDWTTLVLPLRDAPEIAVRTHKHYFNQMRSWFEEKYSKDIIMREEQKKLAFQYNYAQDGNIMRLKVKHDETGKDLFKLINSTSNYIEAARKDMEIKEMGKLADKLRDAIATGDPDLIDRVRKEVESKAKSYKINGITDSMLENDLNEYATDSPTNELEDEASTNGDFDTNSVGFIKVKKQHG